MQIAKHSRESAAKGDDQIAFENATALEEASSYQKALDWYAEVKPTGGRWDMSASAGRVAILTALHRLPEAVKIGTEAVRRMQTQEGLPSPICCWTATSRRFGIIWKTKRSLGKKPRSCGSQSGKNTVILCGRWQKRT